MGWSVRGHFSHTKWATLFPPKTGICQLAAPANLVNATGGPPRRATPPASSSALGAFTTVLVGTMAMLSYVARLPGAAWPVWDGKGRRTGVGADIYKQVEGVVHGEGVQIYIPEGFDGRRPLYRAVCVAPEPEGLPGPLGGRHTSPGAPLLGARDPGRPPPQGAHRPTGDRRGPGTQPGPCVHPYIRTAAPGRGVPPGGPPPGDHPEGPRGHGRGGCGRGCGRSQLARTTIRVT